MCIKPRAQSGFTLIELIISIVILAIALVSIMAVYTRAIWSSVDPMLQQQAVAIAEAYMEEIIGMPTGDVSCTGSSPPSILRRGWRSIGDYDGLRDGDNRPKTLYGETIEGLEDYRVGVEISALELDAIFGCKIEVTVTHERFSAINVLLQGFRALDEVL